MPFPVEKSIWIAVTNKLIIAAITYDTIHVLVSPKKIVHILSAGPSLLVDVAERENPVKFGANQEPIRIDWI